jgi:hypothetical protein
MADIVTLPSARQQKTRSGRRVSLVRTRTNVRILIAEIG